MRGGKHNAAGSTSPGGNGHRVRSPRLCVQCQQATRCAGWTGREVVLQQLCWAGPSMDPSNAATGHWTFEGEGGT